MTEDERREYAREMILKRARVFSVDVEMWARELVGHELDDDDVIAVHELIKSAAIVVTWPDDAANVGDPNDAAEEGPINAP